MPLGAVSVGCRRGRVAVLICAVDHEVANRSCVIAAQCALEGSHPCILERTVEDNVVKEIDRQKIRGAQIGDHAAPHRMLTVARTAVLIVQGLSARNGGRLGWLRRRIDDECARFEGWQHRGAAQFENQQAADIAQIAGHRGGFAAAQRGRLGNGR